MSEMQWFRMWADAVDNPKLRLLAFEDRWHFVALCCLKRSGLIDRDDPNRDRMIALKLGVQVRELEEIARRLIEVDLITDNYSPVGWDDRQFQSDNSTERVRKFRAKQAETVPETFRQRSQSTETETETEKTYAASPLPEGFDQAVIAAYHEVLPVLPAVRSWPKRRSSKLRLRVKERMQEGKPANTVAYWRNVFEKVASSDFLCGRAKDWRCPGLEWLLEPRNFDKIIEGAYDNQVAA
jgi:hypothetical protein